MKEIINISIYHQLNTQESIDLALQKIETKGFTINYAFCYKEIQEAREDGLEGFPLVAVSPSSLNDIEGLSRNEFEQLADKCLECFGDNCFVSIQKKGILNSYWDVFFKGIPNCKCGLIVNHQEGITFALVKDVLEKNGASNIVLNEANYRWMKIDFEVPSLMVNEFGESYLKGIKLNSYAVYGDRKDWSYTRKNLAQDEYYASLKIVKVKHNNSFDYSGDDLSLDPRFW